MFFTPATPSSNRTHATHGKFAATLQACALCVLACLLCLTYSGCSSLRSHYTKTETTTLPAPATTGATRRITAEIARHPAGYSGFRLLALSSEALTARLALADRAVSSIDIQYYMVHDDPTGRLILQHILAAADRGVRVRLLIDDIHIAGNDSDILALNAHPNIEVRLFNPFKNRYGLTLSIATQFLLDGRRLNRRMHNKSFIVDSHCAIIGGRNLGDEYFDARQDVNFRDLDVMCVGPIVSQISKSFDDFWNSSTSYPLEAFYFRNENIKSLAAYRQKLQQNARPYPTTANTRVLFTPEFAINDGTDGEDPTPASSTTASSRFRWCWGSARLIADPPDKADPETDDDPPNTGNPPTKRVRIGEQLSDIMRTTQKEFLLISPYFVPQETGTKLLSELTARGATVKVLTNSLASTDVSMVNAGYARYRPQLLEAGVQLYELRYLPAQKKKNFFKGKRTAGISLHAKAFVIDGTTAFIGSMNIDPRSDILNTEMGVLVNSPELARDLAAFFNEATEPDSSYQAHLAPPDASGNRKLYWTGAPNGETEIFKSDPDASIWRRIKTTFIRLLPIEGML